MVRVACIGIAVLDRIYAVERLPRKEGKYVATGYREAGGGPAATAAVTAAKLGAHVDFIGRVGDDDIATRLLAELASHGVGTSHVQRVKQAASTQSAVLVDAAGERVIVNYPGPDLPAAAEWLDGLDFSGWDVILADVRWHNGARRALMQARKAGVPTVLDADTTPQDIAELAALSDHAVFSAPGLQRLTSETDVREGLMRAGEVTVGHVYVTRGSDGCYWLEGGGLRHQPGFDVAVVDTTGAGDVFHGAMAWMVAQAAEPSQAVRFANAAAALKCTRPDGWRGIPDEGQVRDFLHLRGCGADPLPPTDF